MVRPAPARPVALFALVSLAACGGGDDVQATPAAGGAPVRESPPVALNANSPVVYPPALLAQGVQGTVLLRLYVDAKGVVVPDSTRVAESSGNPGLDSAALASAPALRFAPALRDGAPVASAFLQPIRFRTPRPAGS